ncbi:hypothetical protein MRX96_019456 [Rhipicephalus microplus]
MQAAGRPAAACAATWLRVPRIHHRAGLLRTWTWPSIVFAAACVVAVSAGGGKPEGDLDETVPDDVIGGSSPPSGGAINVASAHKSPGECGMLPFFSLASLVVNPFPFCDFYFRNGAIFRSELVGYYEPAGWPAACTAGPKSLRLALAPSIAPYVDGRQLHYVCSD